MRRLLPLPFLFAACLDGFTPPLNVGDPSEPPVREDPDRPVTPQPDDISDVVFAAERLHVVDIELDETALAQLSAGTGDERVSATITYDGTTITNAGIRRKCGIGSCTSFEDKAGFSIKFDEFVPGQKLFDLQKLVLNNAIQDTSYSNELIGQEVARRAGIPFKRIAHARVNINGEYYGLFVVVESVDKRFLRRHFGEVNDEGNLYEGPCCSDFVFNPNFPELKDIEEGRTREDITAFSQFIRDNTGAAFRDGIESRLDLDRYLTSYALDALYFHWDGYEYNTNNYFLYKNPADDRFIFWLHGMDQLFFDCAWPVDAPPRGLLAQRILADPALSQRYFAEVTRVLDEAWDSDALVARLDQARAIYEQAAFEDPSRGFDVGRFEGVRQCLIDRPDIVRQQLGTLCGDGVVVEGEQCDDGANGDNTSDGCRDDCTANLCGDGILDAGEQCDDGDTQNGDGCSSACVDEDGVSVCGNGLREPGEECDDSNTQNGDSCSASCVQTCTGANGNGIAPFNGHCYQSFNNGLTWDNARAFCAQRGGHLATLSSRIEDNFIRGFAGGNPWLGMSDVETEGTFEWVTKEPVVFQNFSPGEPNDFGTGEDCIQISGSGWNDLPCNVQIGYVCEYD